MHPKQIYIVAVAVFLLAALSPRAQTENPHYNFKHLDVQQGLAGNIVYHFLQDSHGYMWIGTRNGLSMYDGTRTDNFVNADGNETSIAHNFITRIIEDSSQQVWIGTGAGLSRYNRSTNDFINYSVYTKAGKPTPAFCVPLGFGNKNEIWLIETTTGAIKIFNTITGAVNQVATTTGVDATLWHNPVTGDDHVWTYLSIGTIHYTFRNKRLLNRETFFAAPGTGNTGTALQVVHVLIQHDSLAWLSTTAGLIELDPHRRSFKLHNTRAGKPVTELRYAALTKNGLLWVASGNNGVYTYDPGKSVFVDNFQNYQRDPFSICSNNIVSIYLDHLDNAWLGSYGNGLSYTNLAENIFQKSLSRNQLEKWGGSNNVSWVGYDRAGDLWVMIADIDGLWKLDGNRQITEHRLPALENGTMFTGRFYKMLFDDSPEAWCIGQEGLFRYNLKTNRLRKISYPLVSTDLFGSGWVQDMILLRDGSYLFATFRGLYRLSVPSGKNGYQIELYSALNQLQQTSFFALFQDEDGDILVKDSDDKLYVLTHSAANPAQPAIHAIHFLPQINQFYQGASGDGEEERAGGVLLATNSGLYKLDKHNFTVTRVMLGNRPASEAIRSLMKTPGNTWLFGEKGLFYFDDKTGRGRNFTIEDGLPANEFNTAAMLLLPGECITGTTNGLASFNPAGMQEKRHFPTPQLTGIYINDAATSFVPNARETGVINLRHDQNTFSFDLAAVAYQHAAESRFQYMLQGYDPGWIQGGASRYTRYSKIPPGTYQFLLRVLDAGGNPNPESRSLTIVISKAFWQTTLFRILVALLFLGLGWLSIKAYLNARIKQHRLAFEKKQAVSNERTRIASDMHDDLGAGLSTILFLSEKLKRNSSSDLTRVDADRIALNSNELVQKMNEIIWAMNEKNDSLGDLLFYTRSYAMTYCEENGLECRAAFPDTIPAQPISGEARRNIFLTVKESLHNIVKHAKARKVDLEVTIATGEKLVISIKDDGVGLGGNLASDPGSNLNNNSGNGLGNMQARMHSIGGELSITSPGGVSVLISIPL